MGQVQSVPNLIQGVSQQGSQQRRDSQCEAQFDCINSPLNGCEARPPAEFVKLWSGRSLAGSFFHEVVRGSENYVVGVYNGAPFAIDLTSGTDCPVTVESGAGYLTTATPRQSLRAQSVEDTIFLLNREKRPQMKEDISPRRRFEAIVFVRSPAFRTTYAVSLSGPGGNAAASITTPGSDAGEAAAAATTSFIAGSIATQISGKSGYSANVAGSTILIWREDGQDFVVGTSDGNGDDFMYAFKDTVPEFSKLPRRGFEGVQFKVRGESRTINDDFYVTFRGSPATGGWEESLGPAVRPNLDASTMPHLLVQTGYRTFVLKQAAWSSRVAGDEESSKVPSFIGKQVKDIFYHQSRLALLHEAGCVWSKSRYPYTFFPDTVQTLLATAPVDFTLAATSSTKGAALMDFAVQVDETLYLWALRSQFRVSSGGDPFKQDTVEAPLATSYEYTSACDPLALGPLLYFATEAGSYATIRSLQFSQGKAVGDIDVTSHVSNYIPAGLRGMVASDTLRCIFAYTDGDPTALYVYNYLLQEREYVQSAWNKWRIPGGTILWVGLRDNVLSVLQQRAEGVALLRFNLTGGLVDPIAGAGYRTRLDLLCNETVAPVSYDAALLQTTITLPFTPRGPDIRVVLRADLGDRFTRGREFPVASVSGNKVVVQGDLRGGQFYVGQQIEARRTESRFYIRSERGVVPTDRTTVERFLVEMSATGYTRVEVQPDKGPVKIKEFSGRVLGSATGKSGAPELSDAKLDATVGHLAQDVSISLVNDSFLASRWQSAAYEYAAVGFSGQR